MIRQYAPIPLIPAAWALTFATLVYPGIDTYWIQHMHYFMVVFLAGFTLFSWKEMGSDPVLDMWRKVIAAGIPVTALGAASFTVPRFSGIAALGTVLYWFAAPAGALYLSGTEMDSYGGLYRRLAAASFGAMVLFLAGVFTEIKTLTGLSLAIIATVQSASILKASELDG